MWSVVSGTSNITLVSFQLQARLFYLTARGTTARLSSQLMVFCTDQQYTLFMRQVNDVERMLIDSGIVIVKFWLDISQEEQARRFQARSVSPNNGRLVQ